MNAPSVDIADMLVADSSLGLIISDNLFIAKEPTSPAACVTVFDTFGYAPQLTFAGQGEDYYRPSITVRVRDKDYRQGYALAEKIKVSLHGRHQETWNNTFYSLIQATGDPASLDIDNNGWYRFFIGFDIQRR